MSTGIKSVTDATFDAEVLSAQVPVLVDYWAEWCVPCKQMAPALEAVAERYGDRLALAKMDVDANSNTHVRYGVRSCPTLMIFRGGEVVATNVGALTPPRLEAFIEAAL